MNAIKESIIMARNNTTWRKGRSANPQGRPPQNRQLTRILEECGKESLYIGSETLTCEQALANRLWDLASTGQVQLTAGRVLKIESAAEWLALAKWIYTHIDGPAKSDEDHDRQVIVNVVRKKKPLPNEVESA
jgi:hypothetical protein